MREESDKSEFFIDEFLSSHESCLLDVDMDEVHKEILKCSTFAELNIMMILWKVLVLQTWRNQYFKQSAMLKFIGLF